MSIASTNSDSSGGAADACGSARPLSRYESQKRRDWNTFGQYLKNHRPPLVLSRCSGAHVLEFLRYLDQFGKTKVHICGCPFFGHPQPPAPCPCPLRQAWGSLDALVGRLRAAFEENGGHPETNPFGARAVRLYLREVRETQAKARGIAYEKKKRKRPPQKVQPPAPPPPPQQQYQQMVPLPQMMQPAGPSCMTALPILQVSEWNQIYGVNYGQLHYQYHLLDHGNTFIPIPDSGEITSHNVITT